MKLIIFRFLTVLSVIYGSRVENEDFEFDVDTGILESPAAAAAPDVPPIVDWCTWFDHVALWIHGLQISINTDESRIETYNMPIEIAQRVLNTSAAIDHALSPSGQRFVDRLFTGTWNWVLLPNTPRDQFERLLYRGWTNLRSVADADTVNAIIREYTASVVADKARLAQRVQAEKLERQGYIDDVRRHIGQIRSCFEERIDVFEQAQTQHRLELDGMDRVVARISQLREIIVERMQQTGERIGWNLELQRSLRADCMRSVKRIVLSENGAIATELRSDLREIARSRGQRYTDFIYPIYLQTCDDFQRFVQRTHQPARFTLEAEIQGNQRIIDESRRSITELLDYNP